MHLPEKDGNWRGVDNRVRMWALDGTWERVFTALMTQADAEHVREAIARRDGGIEPRDLNRVHLRQAGPPGVRRDFNTFRTATRPCSHE
ncbi:transposase [Streptomyces auratus]